MRGMPTLRPLLIVAGIMLTVATLRGALIPDSADPPIPPREGNVFPAGPADEPGGPGFGPGSVLAPRIIELGDQDRNGRITPTEAARAAAAFVSKADDDRQGSVDVEALAAAIGQELGPPPSFGPRGPGGPFNPGVVFASRIVELGDADKDGRLSPREASVLAERFVREVDREGRGEVNAQSLAQALNQRMGPPPGFGGPGGPMTQERKIVKRFDRDGDGRLNLTERRAARASITQAVSEGQRRGPGGFGGPPGGGFGGPPGGFVREEEPTKPGPRLKPSDVPSYPDKGLYDADVLRTIFLDFESEDWEAELADFHGTDVEVPAEVTVDGRKYSGAGVHFRGMSSYMMVRPGQKRSFNVSLDFVDPEQRLYGYKTLNLLNSHEDPSFLHTVLYSRIARSYVLAPRANLVRVVVNGESWGLFVNAQQFDKILIREKFPDGGGARWKVPGNPGADGGLRYLGEDLADYERRYEMKSGGKKDWQALIALTKVLEDAPQEELERSLDPILDIDGVLWFLALENVLINNDGYWTRASDYSLFRDATGRFHIIPHDMNEVFGPAMGFGFGPPGGGPGGFGPRGGGPRGPGGPPITRSVDLDPLVGLDNPRTPLRGRLLAVPSLRQRYLKYVRTITDDWLDWKKLGPVVAGYRKLIAKAVEQDTRKFSSYDAFLAATADAPAAQGGAAGRGRPMLGLRAFADQRRSYLLRALAGQEATR